MYRSSFVAFLVFLLFLGWKGRRRRQIQRATLGDRDFHTRQPACPVSFSLSVHLRDLYRAGEIDLTILLFSAGAFCFVARLADFSFFSFLNLVELSEIIPSAGSFSYFPAVAFSSLGCLVAYFLCWGSRWLFGFRMALGLEAETQTRAKELVGWAHTSNKTRGMGGG